jgi:UDP-N-acetylmuramyl pentapeptide phosphotransferase/UDP-N-acetylglucosamine-1-phosphate transferase
MNIIDGFHGLASGSALLMITSILLIAYKVDDFLIVRISLLLIITILGFFVWNWPFGKIFLGDGGAYLLGIWIVVLGILLQFRSTNVSPMAPVLIGVYPLIETIFTIYRRKCLRNNKIVLPDALHLHSLIYRRLINKPTLTKKLQTNLYNACVSIYVWLFIITDCLIAVIYYQNTFILIIGIIISIISYIVIYISIIKFKFPKTFTFFR